MKNPCHHCPKVGCGAYHAVCKEYKDWRAELDAKKKWLREQLPTTSEAGLKGQRERIKYGKSRKWNLKNQYNRGDS